MDRNTREPLVLTEAEVVLAQTDKRGVKQNGLSRLIIDDLIVWICDQKLKWIGERVPLIPSSYDVIISRRRLAEISPKYKGTRSAPFAEQGTPRLAGVDIAAVHLRTCLTGSPHRSCRRAW
jgi:hypothetical protein